MRFSAFASKNYKSKYHLIRNMLKFVVASLQPKMHSKNAFLETPIGRLNNFVKKESELAQNGYSRVFEVADHDYDVQIATLTTWGTGTPTKVISVEQNSSREEIHLVPGGFWVAEFKHGIRAHPQAPGAPQPGRERHLRGTLTEFMRESKNTWWPGGFLDR